MTFCTFEDCVSFVECSRALTESVLDEAEDWWGSPEVPLATFNERPVCFIPESEWL